MSTTALSVATQVRNLVSERSPAATAVTIPHIQAIIPVALNSWTRTIQEDPKKRSFLVRNFTPALSGGKLDLTPYVDGTSGSISLDELRDSIIYTTVNGVKIPMTWAASRSQLTYGRYPNNFPTIFLDGYILYTRNTDGSLTSLGSNTIDFTVVDYPSDATEIPAALVGDFVMFLAQLVTQEKLVDSGN